MAFTTDRDGNSEFYVMDANGGDPTRLTTNTVHDVSPTWSPAGTMLAFDSGDAESARVFSMAVDGSGRRPLSKGSAIVGLPDWQAKP